ncbi:MAG: aminoacetone oxidase family FAD-binding enzyme [Clostridiales bacterium]|nr:aminoacetone oxidase family FAD-binding enzyme [Clostridiales bacterium]
MKYGALIIGGGAAGLIAAVSLARRNHRVAVLEAQGRVGRKLLATGNGRCNLTNVRAKPEDYFGDRALIEPALRAFPPSEVLEFFAELGVPSRVDEEGRAYPMSNQAASVLDALRLAFAEAGGEEIADFRVASISKGLVADAGDGRRFRGNAVLAATGGLAAANLGAADAPFLAALGHAFTKRSPALSPLVTEPILALKGLRAHVKLTLDGRAEVGEILFTEYGVSGIAAMQLARFARPGAALSIDFSAGAAIDLASRARALPERRMEDFLNGVVPKRIGQVVAKAAGVSLSTRARELSAREMDELSNALTGFQLPVKGAKGFEHAQVTAGGLTSSDFDPETLESRRVPGLFCAGELLDADGPCGGYNLQWAWASGRLAARSIDERLRQ